MYSTCVYINRFSGLFYFIKILELRKNVFLIFAMSHGKNGHEYLYTITRLYNLYYRILKIPICRYNIIEIVSFF